MVSSSLYVRASTDLDASLPLEPARLLINGLGAAVLLPEAQARTQADVLEREDSESSLEDVGAKAAGADYNPAAFAALRQRQLLAHRRNGSLHERFSVNVWAVTWNVAGLTPNAASVLEALGQPAPDALPDLVLFGVQEAVDLNASQVLLADGHILGVWRSLLEGALTAWLPEMRASDDHAASSNAFSSVPSVPGVATSPPTAARASSASKEVTPPADRASRASKEHLTSAWHGQHTLASERCPYVLVQSVQLVGILLLVWARRDHASHCAEVRTCTVGTGALGFLGNKGAAALRLRFYHSSLAIVNCHLNANKVSPDARNAEFKQISERLAFPVPREAAKAQAVSAPAVTEAPRSAAIVPLRLRHHDVTIWLGDLNYRLNPAPAVLKETQIRSMIRERNLEPLLSCCQLREAIAKGRAFEGYCEAPISFAPTYKYDRNSDSYDSSDKRRTPAWTDRVLWSEQQAEGGLRRVSAAEYGRREVMASDHRPVYCSLNVSVEAESAEKKHRLIKALDAWEESRIPSVLLSPRELSFPCMPAEAMNVGARRRGGAGASASLRKGGSGGTELSVAAVRARSLSVEVRNTGQTVARFSFRDKPPYNRPFAPWLSVTPAEGQIGPGLSAVLTVTVDTELLLAHAGAQGANAVARQSSAPAAASTPVRAQRTWGRGSPASVSPQAQQAAAKAEPAAKPLTRLSVMLDDEPEAEGSPSLRPAGSSASVTPAAAAVAAACAQQVVHAEDVLILTLLHGGDYFLQVHAPFELPNSERFSC